MFQLTLSKLYCKEVFYNKFKMLVKEIKEDTINRKTSHVCGLEVLILLKCPWYSKQSPSKF